jgi:hypothetical protein
VFVRAVRDPVILVLVLAGVVDAMSGSPWSHGALLVAVAVLLGLERIRHRRAERAAAGATAVVPGEADGDAAGAEVALSRGAAPVIRFTPGVVIGGVLYAAIVGSFARFSWPFTIAVGVPGVTAITFAWRRAVGEGPEPDTGEPGGAAAWAILFIVLGLWELINLLLQPSLVTGSYAHPTLSVLTDPILASHVGRSIFLSLWLAFGLFLLER